MIYVIIVLTLLTLYLIGDNFALRKSIKNEKEIQAWQTKYNYALKMNRESLLTKEQLETDLVELDEETKQKYEKEVPDKRGLF